MASPGHNMNAGDELSTLRAALESTQRELVACQRQCNLGHAALRAISDAVVTVDLDGRITFLNPIAAHMTGWGESDSLGRSFAEVVRFTDAHGSPLDVLGADDDGNRAPITALLRRDGHVVLVDGAVAPIVDENREAAGSVITFRNVTAAKRLTSELMYHANHDALTGLVNRRAFESHLRRAIATAGEQGCRHALLYFDLDRFKAVNDHAGHVAGDELLRQLSSKLRRLLREHDTLARLGGDEFAVLLEDCTSAHATLVAEKVRAAVANFAFEWQGETFRVGTSIGQVDFDGTTGMSMAELLMRADEMCYLAKARGRNRVVVYKPRPGGGRIEAGRPAHGRTVHRQPHAPRD